MINYKALVAAALYVAVQPGSYSQEIDQADCDLDLALITESANVLEMASGQSPVIGQLPKGDIVYCHSHLPNGRYSISYDDKEGKEIMGYVDEGKAKPFSKMKELKPKVRTMSADLLSVSNQAMSLTIAVVDFDPPKHQIGLDKHSARIIDGKRAWGTDGGIPHREISSINFVRQGRPVAIPAEEYANLYEPEFRRLRIHADKDMTYIHMTNSDGAGVYDVVFVFHQDKYVRKFVYLNPYV